MGISTYTEIIGDKICDLIAEGNTVLAISQMDDMPSRPTIYKWIAEHTSFRDKYARACTIRRSINFEDMDKMITDTPLDKDSIAITRLRIDTMKWQLSKEEPKKYGDKIDLTSGDKPLKPILVYDMVPDSRKNKGGEDEGQEE